MRSKKKRRSLFQLIFLVFAVSNPWLIAAVVMSVVSAGISIYQGYQQQKIAQANAKRLEIEAQRKQVAAQRLADQAALKRKRMRAAAVTMYAGSGVVVGEGSPLIVEAEDDYRAEQDQLTIIATGAESAWVSRSEAAIMRARGQSAVASGYGRAAGTLAQTASLMGSSGGRSPSSGSGRIVQTDVGYG